MTAVPLAVVTGEVCGRRTPAVVAAAADGDAMMVAVGTEIEMDAAGVVAAVAVVVVVGDTHALPYDGADAEADADGVAAGAVVGGVVGAVLASARTVPAGAAPADAVVVAHVHGAPGTQLVAVGADGAALPLHGAYLVVHGVDDGRSAAAVCAAAVAVLEMPRRDLGHPHHRRCRHRHRHHCHCHVPQEYYFPPGYHR